MRRSFRHALCATCFAALLSSASVCAAEEATGAAFRAGDFLVRGRAVQVLPNVTTNSIAPIGGHADASMSTIPEVDLTYFITPNIAVEAIAGTTRHHVKAHNTTLNGGNVDLGHIQLLPPSITAQYHFLNGSMINPYLGAGLNYTIFFAPNLPKGGTVQSINYDNAFGEVLQAGADIHVAGNWYANIDVKHIFLTTSVNINHHAVQADVNLDPTLVGIGLGYRF